MDLKEKELLLKDLSARLFYNPWVQFNLEYGDNGHKEGSYRAHISSIDPTSGWLEVDYFETETLEKEWSSTIENVKPYLRPMASITEKEEMELTKITAQLTFDRRYSLLYVGRADDGGCDLSEMEKIIDYLISHHFDFRGLISLGLALEAPKGMY